MNQSFISFLNASRFVFQAWNKDYKETDGFPVWWQKKAQLLENNDLCRFFRSVRNGVIKEGKEPFWINQTIKGPVTLQGPIQIGSRGILKGSIEGGRPKWSPVDVEGVVTTIWLKDVPEEFNGESPMDLCEKYLKILHNIVDEFVLTFGSAK